MSTLPTVGTLVDGKYRIEALLGQGGMGAVFRARHELMGKSVALKWLHPKHADRAGARERFMREARAAARIDHPNVVDIYDVGVHEGALFLVMELLVGESFERVLERGSMPIPQALQLLIGSMRGVAAAHRRNIIHRDIKPENIFVVYDDHHADGVAKVLDFGISKLVDGNQLLPRITTTGSAMGTPLYMSFEQLNGAADIDARADVYAFGVLLYRTLTGVHPYQAETLAGLVLAMGTHRPTPPKRLRPELPASIDQVVMKAMAFERAHRYASVAELIDALSVLASRDGFLGQMTHPSLSVPLLTPKESGNSTPPINLPARARVGAASLQPLRRTLSIAVLALTLLLGSAWLYPFQASRSSAGSARAVTLPTLPVRASAPPPRVLATQSAPVPAPAVSASIPQDQPATLEVPSSQAESTARGNGAAKSEAVLPRRRSKKPEPVVTLEPAPTAAPVVAEEPTPTVAPASTASEPSPSATGLRSGTLRRDRL